MRNAPENWECELQRIRKLKWWSDVKGKVDGFPSDPKVYHIHPIALVANFVSPDSCYSLKKALEMALLITSAFEGAHSTTLQYDSVAGNFDGMGMSFGVIQWNFGQGTLAPVLLDMIDVDVDAFKACFDSKADYDTLVEALRSSTDAQMRWATNQQSGRPFKWKEPFKKIGAIQKFNDIQLKHASKYHDYVVRCVNWIRLLQPDLMEKIELQTYCALYDLCVQQQTLNPAYENISTRINSEKPKTQNQLLIIVVEERAKKASSLYQADCLSRRRGILQQSAYSATLDGKTSARENINFSALKKVSTNHVCKL
jgi:hypothetical protein